MAGGGGATVLAFILLLLQAQSCLALSASKEQQALLASINRPFVSSSNLSDGSVVDCVRVEEQLGLQHERLKGHKILKEPSRLLTAAAAEEEEQRYGRRQRHQLFHHEHGACPTGTIPVRRLLASDLERMQTPQIFLRKHPAAEQQRYKKQQHKQHKYKQHKKLKKQQLRPPASDGHQYAIVQQVGSFYGSQAYLSVWDPAVATASDFSLSQLWVGSGANDSINTVEAGWQVYELLNGDRSPHLFIFWTADAYTESGCYNLRCPGFIQTSRNVLLGGAISTVSTPDDSLFFQKFLIFKDPAAWWLQIDNEWVGYWPAQLFTTLADSAQWLQWGGEVCLSGQADGPQMATQMGSGFWPSDGNSRAASQCQLATLDADMVAHDAVGLTQFSTLPHCYAARSLYDRVWGSYIVFGGRGCRN